MKLLSGVFKSLFPTKVSRIREEMFTHRRSRCRPSVSFDPLSTVDGKVGRNMWKIDEKANCGKAEL